MNWTPQLLIGGCLLLIVTGAAVWWLPSENAWSLLGSIAVSAAKMVAL